jgi:hypothetical protein
MAVGKKERIKTVHKEGGNAVYGLGMIGAVVYFLQQADGFWPSILGVLKALVWPAFVVYDLLKFLAS